jgi:hypothetical protein
MLWFLQTLRRARVVGMTTSGVARMQNLVEALQPKVRLAMAAALTACCSAMLYLVSCCTSGLYPLLV